ncbi:MAG: hypothetical protein QXD43_02240 [Candidatus Aenigmatarchaeota archaeon]
MNHSHIKNLISLGYLVDESVANLIENIDEDNFYKLIEGLKKENIFLINNEVIKKILVRDVNIIKEFKSIKKFTMQDLIKNLNEKYEILKNILIKRVDFSDLVSINKISDGSATIIGLVKEKNENSIVLEDPTGDILVNISNELIKKLSLDDVVAVSGKISNKILTAEKLIFPDVPIRPVNYTKSSIKVAFSDNENFDVNYVFTKNSIVDKEKNKKYSVSNPYLVEIEGVLILVLIGVEPMEALRKRYLKIENTDFIIDNVPDIVFSDANLNLNYKGITIASLNKVVDLKTREVYDLK